MVMHVAKKRRRDRTIARPAAHERNLQREGLTYGPGQFYDI